LHANDSAGNLNRSLRQSFIIANQIPSVSAPIVNNTSPYTNDILSCDGGNFSDSDNEDIEQGREFRWYDGTNLVAGQSSQALVLSANGLNKGDSIKCEIRVFDGYNGVHGLILVIQQLLLILLLQFLCL